MPVDPHSVDVGSVLDVDWPEDVEESHNGVVLEAPFAPRAMMAVSTSMAPHPHLGIDPAHYESIDWGAGGRPRGKSYYYGFFVDWVPQKSEDGFDIWLEHLANVDLVVVERIAIAYEQWKKDGCPVPTPFAT